MGSKVRSFMSGYRQVPFSFEKVHFRAAVTNIAQAEAIMAKFDRTPTNNNLPTQLADKLLDRGFVLVNKPAPFSEVDGRTPAGTAGASPTSLRRRRGRSTILASGRGSSPRRKSTLTHAARPSSSTASRATRRGRARERSSVSGSR